MANWPQEAIQRLGAAVKAQRTRRGLTQIQVWEAGGPANSTLTAIESAEQPTIAPATLRKLDHGLGWGEGTSLAVLRGDDADAPIDLSTVPSDVLAEEVRRRLMVSADYSERWNLRPPVQPSNGATRPGGLDR
jgi:transcriptional regulator with XRE-family HTH domain